MYASTTIIKTVKLLQIVGLLNRSTGEIGRLVAEITSRIESFVSFFILASNSDRASNNSHLLLLYYSFILTATYYIMLFRCLFRDSLSNLTASSSTVISIYDIFIFTHSFP